MNRSKKNLKKKSQRIINVPFDLSRKQKFAKRVSELIGVKTNEAYHIIQELIRQGIKRASPLTIRTIIKEPNQ